MKNLLIQMCAGLLLAASVGSDSGQTMGDVLVDAVPPNAVHLCVDMQRFFSSGLPLTVFRFRPEVYSPGRHTAGIRDAQRFPAGWRAPPP